MHHIIFRLLFVPIALLFAINASAQPGANNVVKQETKLTLKGKVGAGFDSMWAALMEPEKGTYVGQQSRISKRSFTITTPLPNPGIYLLMVGDPRKQSTLKYFNIFLENGKAAVTVSDDGSDYQVDEGTPPKAFKALILYFGSDFDSLSMISKMVESAGTYHYSPDSLAQVRKVIAGRIAQKIPSFLDAYKSTAVAPFLLNLVWGLNYPIADVEGWMNAIDSSAMENQYGQSIRELVNVEKTLGYGRPAPLFVQNDPDGNPVSLEKFKGQFVLLDFWASWCGPCRQENPNVVNAYNKYKAKNFTVLGVSLDRDKKKWVQAINDDGLTWTHVSDLGFWSNAVAQLYRVSSIPQNYLLDPEGKIIGKNLRGYELDAFLEKVLSHN